MPEGLEQTREPTGLGLRISEVSMFKRLRPRKQLQSHCIFQAVCKSLLALDTKEVQSRKDIFQHSCRPCLLGCSLWCGRQGGQMLIETPLASKLAQQSLHALARGLPAPVRAQNEGRGGCVFWNSSRNECLVALALVSESASGPHFAAIAAMHTRKRLNLEPFFVRREPHDVDHLSYPHNPDWRSRVLGLRSKPPRVDPELLF
mmetsp:Transcript_35235/g.75043  ORF Transcript_35235/g.75043 Transcript_35235/m.75043 type:complete len:203 (-) Transcript_35235:486-1094(-)